MNELAGTRKCTDPGLSSQPCFTINTSRRLGRIRLGPLSNETCHSTGREAECWQIYAV